MPFKPLNGFPLEDVSDNKTKYFYHELIIKDIRQNGQPSTSAYVNLVHLRTSSAILPRIYVVLLIQGWGKYLPFLHPIPYNIL